MSFIDSINSYQNAVKFLGKGIAYMIKNKVSAKAIHQQQSIVEQLNFAFEEMEQFATLKEYELHKANERYQKLHHDTQKLVSLVELSGAFDPNLVFLDKNGSIEQIWKENHQTQRKFKKGFNANQINQLVGYKELQLMFEKHESFKQQIKNKLK